jgi:hypothetical protein
MIDVNGFPATGLKYLEYISSIRIINNIWNNWPIIKTAINVEIVKQKNNNVELNNCKTEWINNFRRMKQQKLHGWLSRSSPSRPDGSRNSQVGKLNHVSGSSQRQSKTKLSLRGCHQVQVHSDQMVHLMTRLDLVNVGKRRSRESWKTILGSQWAYLKTGIMTA